MLCEAIEDSMWSNRRDILYRYLTSSSVKTWINVILSRPLTTTYYTEEMRHKTRIVWVESGLTNSQYNMKNPPNLQTMSGL